MPSFLLLFTLPFFVMPPFFFVYTSFICHHYFYVIFIFVYPLFFMPSFFFVLLTLHFYAIIFFLFTLNILCHHSFLFALFLFFFLLCVIPFFFLPFLCLLCHHSLASQELNPFIYSWGPKPALLSADQGQLRTGKIQGISYIEADVPNIFLNPYA